MVPGNVGERIAELERDEQDRLRFAGSLELSVAEIARRG